MTHWPPLTPSYVRTAAHRWWRNQLTALCRPASGWAPPPTLAVLRLTDDCNLRCKTCFDLGQGCVGDAWQRPGFEPHDALTADDWRRVVDALAPAFPTFYLTGGEPLLSPALLPVVAAIKRHGLYVSINTNAVLLESMAHDLVAAGVDKLIVSVDGPREIHNAIRGDTFDQVAAGVRAIDAYKKEKGTRRPYVRAQTVITPVLAGHLAEAVEAVRSLGIGEIRFQHLVFAFPSTPDKVDPALKSIVQRVRVSAPLLEEGVMDGNALTREIEKLAGKYRDRRVLFEPPLRTSDIVGYYTDPRHPFRNNCLSAWRRLVVSPLGELSPCQGTGLAQFPADDPLKAWDGDAFRAFRRHMRAHGLFAHCNRCCHREYYRPPAGLTVS